ncbi:SusC/RagA family TonB-linked outer membrane protein [Capnocytophaga sp.]|uniref:SusC/RagA family TonB-linked outer membrane protein n=1 Tax=Capnocytophaga sp. TaxID=44737 RepID=UPI0026DDAE86|nr:SusC/RagA family TonB-linked outer membrane protein [Capnocytophaga sp.]MDO5105586.1 SusC/RagA family TonB-linked outer membrane protein [Capnocytophaga sp.]
MRERTICLVLLFFLAFGFTFAQEKTITGTVKDEGGIPLPGVTVIIKGEQKGTQTDFDGKYTIKASVGKTLQFSYIGMITVDKKVGTLSKIDVVLKESAEELEQVVVTGITTTDRRLFTGAADKIVAETTRLAGVPDVSRALEGRSAGVTVQNVSGTFGAAPKIRVRGATSIYGNQKPLWVVDGIIIEDVVELGADALSSGDATTLISSAIAGLNADDIESFEVLKDGSATSIYGARAMAGVIVITTKRGKAGVSTFNYSNESTFRFIPSYTDFNIMNSQEQMSVYEEMRNGGWLNYADVATAKESGVYGQMYKLLSEIDPATGQFKLENTPEAKAAYLREAELRNTNWFNALFSTNVMQNHSVSMSSGTEKSTYYGSLSALVDPGWTVQSKVNRYTGNFNSNFKLSESLSLNIITNASYRKQRAPGTLSQSTDAVSGEVKRDFDINPYSFAINSSRTLRTDEFYKRNYAPFNIFHELDNNYMDLNVVDLRFQGELQWKISPKINFSNMVAIKYQNTNIDHHATEFSNQANAYRAMETATIRDRNPLLYKDRDNPHALPESILPQGGIYRRTNYNLLGYDFRSSLAYKDIINNDHTVNLNLGAESNSTDRNNNKMRGYGLQYALGEQPFYVLNAFKRGIEENDLYYSISNTRYRNMAFFANGTYSWKHRYTINGTLRYEGTNKLGRSRSARWLPTWNISGAWNVHEEDFFSKQKYVSHLTLKGSYSLTADRGPSWVTNSLVDIRSTNPWRPSTSTQETALYVYSLQNSELTYEKKKEVNVGIDVGFLNGRINVGADYYTRNNYDLIGITTTQGLGGEIQKYGNVAKMKSSGLELSINTVNVKTDNFSWETNFTYAKANNEIVRLDNFTRVIDLVKSEGFAREGYPARSLFSFDYRGLNSSGVPTFINEKGELTSTDLNFQERKKINHLVYSGSVDPTDTGGLSNLFRYKGLKLNVFITYSFGNVVRLNPIFSKEYSDLDAMPREFANRWVVAGDENHTDIPVIATRRMDKDDSRLSRAYNAYNYSSARIAKGDFIRLKEISLGYDFDKELVEKFKLKNLGLKLQATNLFLLYADKKLNGQDPEFFNSGGVATPMSKQITLSLKIGI